MWVKEIPKEEGMYWYRNFKGWNGAHYNSPEGTHNLTVAGVEHWQESTEDNEHYPSRSCFWLVGNECESCERRLKQGEGEFWSIPITPPPV